MQVFYSYLADYIREEGEVSAEIIKNAIDAFEGGAADGNTYEVSIAAQQAKKEKLKFRIHYGYLKANSNEFYAEDSIVIEGDTIKEIREIAADEIKKRNAVGIYSEEL